MSPMDFNLDRTPNQQQVIKSALDLGHACNFEEGHTLQVTRLALSLFDELKALHHLGEQEKYWLQLASILHDIGWVEGWQGHHKASLRIILNSPILPLDNRERLIIGSIARYHRKALPDLKHDHYTALDDRERMTVSILAAILRVADGLDRSHHNTVKDLQASVNGHNITINCQCDLPSYEEEQAALKKGDLMESLFNKKLVIQWTIL